MILSLVFGPMLFAMCCGYGLETAYETLSAGVFKMIPPEILIPRMTVSTVLGTVSFPTAYFWAKEMVKREDPVDIALAIFVSALLVELIVMSLVRSSTAAKKKR